MSDIELMTTQEIIEVLLKKGTAGFVALEQFRDDHEQGKQVLLAYRGADAKVFEILCGLTVDAIVKNIPAAARDEFLVKYNEQLAIELARRAHEPTKDGR